MVVKLAVPLSIRDEVNASGLYENRNARGRTTSYGLDLKLDTLGLFKNLKSTDINVLACKAQSTLNTWAEKFDKYLMVKDHERMNVEAKEAIEELKSILVHTLDIDDTVDWESLKRKDSFTIKPEELFGKGKEEIPGFIKFSEIGKPVKYKVSSMPEEPNYELFRDSCGFISKVFRSKEIQSEFQKKYDYWQRQCEAIKVKNDNRSLIFKKYLDAFENKEKAFEKNKKESNLAIDEAKKRYLNAEYNSIEEYCDLVLMSSKYPDYFPRNWELEYHSDSRLLIVQSSLPEPAALPRVESYRLIKSTGEITEKLIPEATRKKMYDNVIYQICIRTIHEIFESDAVDAIDTIAFNGVVTARNQATGVEESKIILSITAGKEEFLQFDLANVDPKATFKHLKGVAAAVLSGLTPIPPIIQLNKSDKRFIEGKSIEVDSSVNLASMYWEDFEHLIRELFEKEFVSGGGEVKVTQGSSDGGVDAIAFDPDPIRGGKIVIQAKRYTNTVGVAAVRDLYGTVLNEGATKGILVTTSDYGNDSYEFAKDKPITLLNGGNLLSLLEKHGQQARINITEAKKILNG